MRRSLRAFKVGAIVLMLTALGALTAACGATLESSTAPQPTTSEPLSLVCGNTTAVNGGQVLARPDGARIWYRDIGPRDAPPLLYVHGGPGYNSYLFERSVGAELATTHRLILVDQRGCGRSAYEDASTAFGMAATIEDFEALRTKLGLDAWHVVAHSFGGLVGVTYARRFPHAVASLVLVETTSDLPEALQHQVTTALEKTAAQSPAVYEKLRAEVDGQQLPFARLLATYKVLGPQTLQALLHWGNPENQPHADGSDEGSGLLVCTQPQVVSTYQEEGWLDESKTELTGPLPMKAALIGARKSHVIGAKNLRKSADDWQVPLLWMESSGHFPYIEQPSVFVSLVRQLVHSSSPR